MKYLILVLCISGCASVATNARLPVPPRPELPAIPATEMMCLSDEAYRSLVQGRKLLLNHINTLENIIISTH